MTIVTRKKRYPTKQAWRREAVKLSKRNGFSLIAGNLFYEGIHLVGTENAGYRGAGAWIDEDFT